MHSALKYLGTLAGCAAVAVTIAYADSARTTTHDKYSVKVPGGLAFAEFKGYEGWETIAISQNGQRMEVILGNPAMINAFKAGTPANGKTFPDGAKMAKVHWEPKKQTTYPGQPLVPGRQTDVDVMVKDSKRFADSGGWGYAFFKYDAAADKFTPATQSDQPPQANDAKCGFGCHAIVKARDYVFTEYATR